ncbi:hypothetical protein TNIN_178821 [Trichonephila inaurata madagascariensis]|uniref:Uncharacterized protein n=1 Tax=Trichonephila inaurata madagascariensis TaxID=2747483 RepID=A0A8X7BSW6_9ARAC|nr:hypothetical protein TNIN_178821 [Trichonephila inaurata madagascariensis]
MTTRLPQPSGTLLSISLRAPQSLHKVDPWAPHAEVDSYAPRKAKRKPHSSTRCHKSILHPLPEIEKRGRRLCATNLRMQTGKADFEVTPEIYSEIVHSRRTRSPPCPGQAPCLGAATGREQCRK